MNIHLSPREPVDKSYQWVQNIATLNGLVSDSEARAIVCDMFLAQFTYDEIPQVLPRLRTHIVKQLINVRRLHSVAEMAKNVEMATVLPRRQKCCRGGKVLPGWPKFYRDGSSCA